MAGRRTLGSFAARSVVLALALSLGIAGVQVPIAGAIEDGWDADDTPVNRATVHVGTSGSTCSGVLIAPDLVLTARHCFRHEPPSPAPHDPRGAGFEDWELPDRFYPLDHLYPTGVDVHVGHDRTSPAATISALEYSLPGNIDIALLKLSAPVSLTLATPVDVVTSIDATEGLGRDDLGSLVFAVFGFGKTGPDDGFSATLQEGRSGSGEFPCPRHVRGWTEGDVHRICVAGLEGGVRSGDSGGPLFWDDDGARSLVGIFQGLESQRNGGRYTATFFRGAEGYDGTPRGDVGGWLDRHLTPFRVRNSAGYLFGRAWI